MRRVRLSARAESDLIDIWHYGIEQWDEERADRYLYDLGEAIEMLTEHPELGVSRDYVREGYRVLFVNRHAIYYKVLPSAIRIVRVLHGQRDPERHV